MADAKRDALLQAASESDDPQLKQQYLAEAAQWDESGRYRVGLQSAGGSLVGGIGGGLLGAAQSGAGSLVSALLANKLDAVSRQIADQKPTGNADLDKTLGNIVANVMSSVAGGVVGGTQGAQAAYNVDRFNRQLHPQEKALAQQLAEKSGDKYSQQQIEDQMRQMSMTEGGQTYAGSPDTLIGEQRPTDAEAKWVYAGETADGKPILTQATVTNNAELQRYIVDAMSSSDVPSTISYTAAPMQPELGPRRYALKPPKPCATAECAAGLTPAGMLYYPPDLPKEQIADTAAALSTAAGRFGATTGAIAAIPSPYAPAATTLTLSAAMVGLGASAVEQVFRPNPVAFGVDSFIDLGTFTATEKYPLWGPVINELGNYIKGSDWVIKQKNQKF
ncbi:hemolysin [Mycetohabitans endofungorum]|uniref:hemolysin n=1 Tax=Mycetohabitans endofungorum TaxID=417203 RepID=UPI0011B0C531|nr:hemolysin [Mycetohabitans endofungorum]